MLLSLSSDAGTCVCTSPQLSRCQAARQSTARVVCQNTSSQGQQEGGEVTTRAPQPEAMPPWAGAEAWLQHVCGTRDDGLFSAAWISQPGISGMRKPWVFDGLPAINSKLTPMKVVLWYFYCLKFKSLLWPQSLNFPLTRATHGASEAPLTSVGGWMQRILHWPKEQYKSVFTAAYCSQLVPLYT